VQGFVLPTLSAAASLGARRHALPRFFRENFGDRVAGENVQDFMQHLGPAGGHRALGVGESVGVSGSGAVELFERLRPVGLQHLQSERS
jgi:hypothetical protein